MGNKQIFNSSAWLFALVGLGAVIVAGGILLSASPVAREVDLKLNVSTPQDGSSVWRFTEGCAISRFGKHGLNPCAWVADLDIKKTIFLHGDSFVEALQVSDECKPDAVLAKCLGGKTRVIGIGRSGAGFPSMIVRARAYEEAFGVPKCHLFFSSNIHNDVFGDEGDEFARTEQGIEQRPPKSSASQMKMARFINRFRLNCLLSAYQGLQGIMKKRWRFAPHFPKSSKPTVPKREQDIEGELRFLCGEMRKDIAAPIIVVYCPQIPYAKQGQIVLKDENGVHADAAKKVLAEYGIGIVDVTPALLDYWNEHGGFVRGFDNNLGPGGGHLNEEGIKVVFGCVAKAMEAKL